MLSVFLSLGAATVGEAEVEAAGRPRLPASGGSPSQLGCRVILPFGSCAA